MKTSKFLKFESYSRDAMWTPSVFSNQIAISGKTAGGKSTLINLICQNAERPLKRLSGGETMRQWAAEKGMEIEQFNAYALEHPELKIDQNLDVKMYEGAFYTNDRIGEARLSYLTMPRAFKVRLVCDLHVRAYRRQQQNIEDNKKLPPDKWKPVIFEEVLTRVLMRDVGDSERYDPLYPDYQWRDEHFDLVLNMEFLSPQKAAGILIQSHQDWLGKIRKTNRRIIDRIAA